MFKTTFFLVAFFCFSFSPLNAKGKALSVAVPKGVIADLDGNIGPKEWVDAIKLPVESGEVRLKHDGTNLLICINTKNEHCKSLFFEIKKKVYVLHSSARLATAIYSKSKKTFKLKSPFEYLPAGKKFEKRDGWIATISPKAQNQTVEFKIPFKLLGWKKSTSKSKRKLKFALSSVSYDLKERIMLPAKLSGGTVNQKLLMGESPSELSFNSKKWIELVMSKSAKGKEKK